MSYAHVEVELTEPLAELSAGRPDEGVGLISSRHRRVGGLALDRLAPGTHRGPSAVEALLHLDAAVPGGLDSEGSRMRAVVVRR